MFDVEAEPADDITLDELTRLALLADPDLPVPDDAVPVWELFEPDADSLLPAWYMPAPSGPTITGRRWKRVVALMLITAFLAINASGLCSTYGWISIAAHR